MDSIQLYRFKCIAESESLSNAAEVLFISQPTLSMMLRNLEKELQCTLFERKGNRLQITTDGKKLLEVANTVCDLIKSTEQEFKGTAFDRVTLYSSDHFFHALLPNFGDALPKGMFLKVVANKNIPGLLSATHSVSAICDDFYMKTMRLNNYICRFLFREDMYLAVRKDHPWAERKTMDVTDIGSEELFCISGNTGFSQWVEDMAQVNKIKLHYVLALDAPMSYIYRDAIQYPRFVSSRIAWDKASICRQQESYIKLTGEYTQRNICLWYSKNIYTYLQSVIDDMCARAVELNNLSICFNEEIDLTSPDLKINPYLS
jgi:DNA-binding transcriptional LysR family regulator